MLYPVECWVVREVFCTGFKEVSVRRIRGHNSYFFKHFWGRHQRSTVIPRGNMTCVCSEIEPADPKQLNGFRDTGRVGIGCTFGRFQKLLRCEKLTVKAGRKEGHFISRPLDTFSKVVLGCCVLLVQEITVYLTFSQVVFVCSNYLLIVGNRPKRP